MAAKVATAVTLGGLGCRVRGYHEALSSCQFSGPKRGVHDLEIGSCSDRDGEMLLL